jgi:RHS repeat-associated protein
MVLNPDGHYTKYTLGVEGLITKIEQLGQNLALVGPEIQRVWAENRIPWDFSYGIEGVNYYLQQEIVSTRNSSGTLTKSAVTTSSYDGNGNLTEKDEYDWTPYNQNPSTLKRKTTYNYYVSATANSQDYPNAYWNVHNTSIWAAGTSRRLNAVKRQTIFDGSSNPKAATEYVYDSPYNTGNVTSQIQWDNTRLASLPALGSTPTLPTTQSKVTTFAYDSYGNLTDKYESGVQTHITYDANRALVMQVDAAYGTSAQRSVGYVWLNGAAVGSMKDVDNNLTTYYTYDNVGRQLSVNEAGLLQTQTSYDDANRQVTVKSDLRIFGDSLQQSITSYDQLGRASLVQNSDGSPIAGNSDGTAGIKTATYYRYLPHDQYVPNSGGNYQVITTTPYRSSSDSTLQWTCTQYDLLNRVSEVAVFNGSFSTALPIVRCGSYANPTSVTWIAYDIDDLGNKITITDPAGKVKTQFTDALGNLVKVIEDPTGLNYSTTYSYDVLGNLTQVNQLSQTRTFAYSSLGRLLSATNPESGTTSYSYYDSGDLYTKEDARLITTTMTYDPLHRILTKSYSDGTPSATYAYYLSGSASSPNIGQLKSVSSSVASATYLYNQFGEVTTSTHTVNGFSGSPTFVYNYYLNGALQSELYPSGRLVNYSVDDAGRTNRVYTASTNYADATGSSPAFTADGRLTQMKLGNNLWETYAYQTPGTATSYRLGTTQGNYNLAKLDYNFSATQNNGNVQSQAIMRNGSSSWNQTYSYDNVNRLSSVSESAGGSWSQSYGYDPYGNRYISATSGIAVVSQEPTSLSNFNAANNRLTMTGITYDAAGNENAYSSYTLTYDAESRNTTVNISGSPYVTFAYDGDGQRVKKQIAGGATTYYVYDALGQMAMDYSTQAPTTTGTSYMFTDMLGSVRTITDQNGNVVENYDYLPFGRMLKSSDNGRSAVGNYPSDPDNNLSSRTPQKFTGQERDAETGLDNFGARYVSAAQGRFMSPDPLGNFVADPGSPQSWNLYSYVNNNPLNYVDPTGYDECYYDGVLQGNQDERTCRENGPSDDSVTWYANNPTYQIQVHLSSSGTIASDSSDYTDYYGPAVIPDGTGATNPFLPPGTPPRGPGNPVNNTNKGSTFQKIKCSALAGAPVVLDLASFGANFIPGGALAKMGIGMGLGIASSFVSGLNSDITGVSAGVVGMHREPLIAGLAAAKKMNVVNILKSIGPLADLAMATRDGLEAKKTYNACMSR